VKEDPSIERVANPEPKGGIEVLEIHGRSNERSHDIPELLFGREFLILILVLESDNQSGPKGERRLIEELRGRDGKGQVGAKDGGYEVTLKYHQATSLGDHSEEGGPGGRGGGNRHTHDAKVRAKALYAKGGPRGIRLDGNGMKWYAVEVGQGTDTCCDHHGVRSLEGQVTHGTQFLLDIQGVVRERGAATAHVKDDREQV
jgi:hypothetical protein